VKGTVELQAFERMIDKVQQNCGFCWVLTGVAQAEHMLNQCSSMRKRISLEESEQVQEMVRVDKKCQVCWRCRVSQQICDRVEKGQLCRWSSVAAVLWLAWLHTTVVQEAGFQRQGIKEYTYWLGLQAQTKIQGVIVSNGMWLL
jgi:hypothetical protein